MTKLQDLPDDILCRIASGLSVKDIFTWRLANKCFDSKISGLLGQMPISLAPCKNINSGLLAHLCITFPSATSLDLSECDSLHADVILTLPTSLEQLNLRDCEWLTEKGCEYLASRLANLKDLNVEDCDDVGVLPECMTKLSKLEVLNTNALFAEPATLRCMITLVSLQIHCNTEFSAFPAGMSALRSLRNLGIRFCESFTVLEGLDGLSSLEVLEVKNCGLVRISESVSDLQALKKVTIEAITLEALPAGLGSLRQLQELKLVSCSSLTSLPESLSGLRSLESLYINSCSALRSIPNGLLDQLPALKVFDVAGSKRLREINYLGRSIRWRH